MIAFYVLLVREVKAWPRFAAVEWRKFHVTSDSNHFEPASFLMFQADGLSDGILIGPVLSGHAFADHCDVSAVIIVRILKATPAQDFDAVVRQLDK